MSEWIKCIDRLPNTEKVLAIFCSENNVMYNMRHDGWFRDTIYSCRFDKSKFIIESHGPVFEPTHWMPLPLPPKEI